LPFLDGCFGAVAALWMLYYVPEPFIVLAEVARVLRASGVFVACTSSRYNDPEFAEVIPGWGEPFSFDAETAMDVVAEQFSITEILRWNKAVVWLPDVTAVRLFLRGRGLSETAAASDACPGLDCPSRSVASVAPDRIPPQEARPAHSAAATAAATAPRHAGPTTPAHSTASSAS
jgi:SAM-dependent methyltransferase